MKILINITVIGIIVLALLGLSLFSLGMVKATNSDPGLVLKISEPFPFLIF